MEAQALTICARAQVYGPESSGKTTLALHAMAEVQKSGGTAALIDAEHAFDPEYSKVAVAVVQLSQIRSIVPGR